MDGVCEQTRADGDNFFFCILICIVFFDFVTETCLPSRVHRFDLGTGDGYFELESRTMSGHVIEREISLLCKRHLVRRSMTSQTAHDRFANAEPARLRLIVDPKFTTRFGIGNSFRGGLAFGLLLSDGGLVHGLFFV